MIRDLDIKCATNVIGKKNPRQAQSIWIASDSTVHKCLSFRIYLKSPNVSSFTVVHK